jgi:hypothetical protein
MNIKEEQTEIATQGPARSLQTGSENSDYDHKPGD